MMQQPRSDANSAGRVAETLLMDQSVAGASGCDRDGCVTAFLG
jgi:hypothetical protein